MNDPPAGAVLPDMRIHRRNGRAGIRDDHTTDGPGGRRRHWRARRNRPAAGRTPGTGQAQPLPARTASGDDAATAIQVDAATAIQVSVGLLTASLDSPKLEAWAVDALTPPGADGLCTVLVGMHFVAELLLHELYAATGELPAATLQRLAILAEHRRGTPSAG